MTRFPEELAHFLDRGDGDEAGEPEGPQRSDEAGPGRSGPVDGGRLASAPESGGSNRDPARWALEPQVSLATAAGAALLHASNWLAATSSGKVLRRDLATSHRPPVSYRVEAFTSAGAMADRIERLQGTTTAPEERDLVSGITVPQRAGDGRAVARFKDGSVQGFHILLVVPRLATSTGTTISVRDTVLQSNWFRVLAMTETLFHELLHAWWIATHARPDDFATYDDGFEILAPVDRPSSATGHADVSWTLDPLTLSLSVSDRSKVEADFADRLIGHVENVVEHRKLRQRVKQIEKGMGRR